MFRHTEILFNNSTETEYKSVGTYLCVLFHIVTFDIKALVIPWHQFVYTSSYHVATWLFNRHPSGCEAFTSNVLLHFWKKRKKFDSARPGLFGGCSKMSHPARLVSAGKYADVHCHATEQFHARSCLFSKIT